MDASTDANGFINLEGYKGKYEITAGDQKGCFILSQGGDVVIE